MTPLILTGDALALLPTLAAESVDAPEIWAEEAAAKRQAVLAGKQMDLLDGEIP